MKEKKFKHPSFEEKTLNKFKDTTEKIIGWGKVSESIWYAFETSVECEAAYRAKKRAKALKIPGMIEYNEEIEEMNHKQSVKHFKQVQHFLEKAKKDTEKKQYFEDIAKEKLEEAQMECLKHLKHTIMDFDIDGKDIKEFIQIYDESFDLFKKKGYEGLIDDINDKIDKLIERRSDKSKNRGRDEGNIVFWKVLGVALAFGVGVLTVLYCIRWRCEFWGTFVGALGTACLLILSGGC